MQYESRPPTHKRRKGFIGVSRATLRALWGDNCYLCHNVMLFNPRDNNDPRYATLEHIVPRSEGGEKTWENIKLACRSCNNDKKALSLDEYLAKKEAENGDTK